MKFVQTTALKKILELNKRLKVIQGGSSAGKTVAILLIFIDRAQSEKGKIFSVVSESMPHLKRGALRDFLSIMETHNYFKEGNFNRTDLIYTFETGSKIEFFSADQPGKVRGPRRDVLFINEVNNISYDTYTQLVIRTNEDIYLDYNPVSSFFIQEEVIPKHDHDFVILTYKDNEALAQAVVEEIESRRENKNFWKVYGLGELGELEGKIYTNWKIIDEIPHEARLERYGLDFGYTNDPTAVIALYYWNGGFILDEIVYRKGMSNKQIADHIKNLKEALVVADSAEPKSIDEIASYGISIVPATKGPGSRNQRIQLVQDKQISVTKKSVNVIKEYRNYLWKTDVNGKIINIPEHAFSHSMDAAGYAMSSLAPVIEQHEYLEKRGQTIAERMSRSKSIDNPAV